MARFSWGGVDDGGPVRGNLAAITVVEADRYVIDGGFVTFVLNEENIVSVPERKVAVVSKLNDDNSSMFHLEEPKK
ncbi:MULTISPECIES: hypothetical protein [Mycobacterium avium complex (MAC)]|uniref:hypothetical protein n=1 Tax=Mycobacterium avium complex (MAC) TaxID=120793 RepID=UPI00044F4BD0|nr:MULTISPECIES: hypothetical protein [Mycobacterium avium complex (MAC)]ETZ44229.1 hypothetical protein L837_4355 [Mycobacterium avium MAV_061107_1842]MBG0730202.1 hypothetical protein [Mycobacterium avium]MBZ4548921.1 hypothetical protein [Mycobacterium avium subsp. hominissuis]MBZ4583073.1 hypothetical protein [Mycobacterium avium subsp. hominissuis]MBZ4595386.1 hypothetical protein [Mycobacterium avium subsp. hominissuis]